MSSGFRSYWGCYQGIKAHRFWTCSVWAWSKRWQFRRGICSFEWKLNRCKSYELVEIIRVIKVYYDYCWVIRVTRMIRFVWVIINIIKVIKAMRAIKINKARSVSKASTRVFWHSTILGVWNYWNKDYWVVRVKELLVLIGQFELLRLWRKLDH